MNKFWSSQHADVRHNTCTVLGLRLNPAFEKEIYNIILTELEDLMNGKSLIDLL